MSISQSPTAALSLEASASRLLCRGAWTVNTIQTIENIIEQTTWPPLKELTIDGQNITHMDSSGAWQLHQLQTHLKKHYPKITLENFHKEQQSLLTFIQQQAKKISVIPKITYPGWLYRVGKNAAERFSQFTEFLNFIGEASIFSVRALLDPKLLRWRSIASTIETTGYQALPIIALLSFMIGVVLTYQTGLQLRTYGANIFIVDLLGIGILREFGPLLTAIMVAGRTGSAFTAQIGTMKLNEEIDALRTMGISPTELLVVPRLIGLCIALPLLTIWADFFGILGGMVMAKNMLNISWDNFILRFEQVISVRWLLTGIGKTPLFALLIASIGCFQGLKVLGRADSIGKQTTKSVVQAIFFIIVTDAAFSVLFSKFQI